MEEEEIQAQACKYPRIGNGGRGDSNRIGPKEGGGAGGDHFPDDEEDGELKRAAAGRGANPGNRLHGWHHSRIIRVSRASGGKDRHSKVWTSKGLRDRRVRLAVTTAIQFYDLQDRLGYDQPSKAVEWLIKAAADAIAELRPLNNSFPDTPKQFSDEKRASSEHGFDSAEVELDCDPNNYHHHHHQQQQQNQNQNQNQHLSLSKSACSSNSETSKGSGLSLSRSEIRVNRGKARERARVRAAKEKEKENESSHMNAHHHHHHQNMNPIAHNNNASFTELLTAGIGNVTNNNSTNSPNTASAHQQNPDGGEPSLFHKAVAAAAATPMDYFSLGLHGLSSSSRTHHSSGFSAQIHLGNSLPQTMSVVSPFSLSGDTHGELQHFSFVPDQLIPVVSAAQPNIGGGGDYNLNFSISSSGVAGFNRGTLQSNSSSPSLLPHFQRFSPIDGSNVPFFHGAVGPTVASTAPTMENHHHHHQFPSGFDRRLQQHYGDGSRHSDHKGKAKN